MLERALSHNVSYYVMSLLDQNISSFIIKPQKKLFSRTLDIDDGEGNNLGKIHCGIGEHGTYKLLDLQDTVVLTCKKKVTIRTQKYEIKDTSKDTIATVKRPAMSRYDRTLWMEDNNENEIFRSEVPSMPGFFEEIYDEEGNVIAKQSRVKGSDNKSSKSSKDYWELELFNSKLNKLLLWGFFLAVVDIYPVPDKYYELGTAGG